MRRRRFVELCAGGAVAGLVGCIPGDPEETGRGGTVRILGDGGPPDPSGDAGAASDAGRRGVDGSAPPPPRDGGHRRTDAGPSPDPDAGSCDEHVMMHDTHAQALYFDGGHGPHTGIIRVEWIVAGDAVELAFWHGHGGVDHRFTVRPEHFAALTRGERVTLETSEVEGHSHRLFIDPVDERWRVAGAEDVRVPLC